MFQFSYMLSNQFLLVVIAFVLGILISAVCTQTSKCTRNMSFTLLLLPPLVCAAILAVNGSLGTGIATLGVFSLVRFRSVPGKSRDIVNVLYSVVAGLLMATGYVWLAVGITIVIGVLIFVISNTAFRVVQKHDLKILVPENLNFESVFDEIIGRYFDKFELKKIKTTNMGALYELSYEVLPKSGANIKSCMDEIRTKNGNLTVTYCRTDDSLEL